MRAVAGYSITSNATESALASADGYASEPISLGAGGIAFEAESRGDFFWKPEIRPPKNSYFDQTFLIKRGALALGSPDFKEQLQCVKGQVQKMPRIFERR